MLISSRQLGLSPHTAVVAPMPTASVSTTTTPSLPNPKAYLSSTDSDLKTLCECIDRNINAWPLPYVDTKENKDFWNSQATLFASVIRDVNKKIAAGKFNISEENITRFKDITRLVQTKCSMSVARPYTELLVHLTWRNWQKEQENFDAASYICKGGLHQFKGKEYKSNGLPDCLKDIVYNYAWPGAWSVDTSYDHLHEIQFMLTENKKEGLSWLASWIKDPRCYNSDLYKRLTLEDRLELAAKPHLLKCMTFKSIREFFKYVRPDYSVSVSQRVRVSDYNFYLLHLLDAADSNNTKGFHPFTTRLNLVAQACANSRRIFLYDNDKYLQLIMRLRPKLSNLFLHNQLLTLFMSNDDIGLKLLARCLEVPYSFDEDVTFFTLLSSRIDKLIPLLSNKVVLDFDKAPRLTLDILERMDASDKNFHILANTVNAQAHSDLKVKQALREIRAHERFWKEKLFSLLLPQIRNNVAKPNWLDEPAKPHVSKENEPDVPEEAKTSEEAEEEERLSLIIEAWLRNLIVRG